MLTLYYHCYKCSYSSLWLTQKDELEKQHILKNRYINLNFLTFVIFLLTYLNSQKVITQTLELQNGTQLTQDFQGL